MRRLCHLHIGLPKTGTTSIQQWVREHSAALASRGFLVPQTGLAQRGGHDQIALWLGGHQQTDAIGQRLAAELEASSAEAAVISSEKIARRLLDRDYAAALFDRLSALDLEPRIVMTVRNQPQLFNSAYCQLTRTFRWHGTLGAFIASHESAAPAFNMRIADTAAAFGAPLTVLRYDSQIASSFLAAIGASDLDQPCSTGQRANQSVGPFTVEVARGVHLALPQLTLPEANKCARTLKRILERSGFADSGYCGLTTQTAREIEATFADHNNAFAVRVWGRPWIEVFASDIGQEFLPNDYQMTGTPPDMQRPLKRLVAETERRCRSALEQRRSRLAQPR